MDNDECTMTSQCSFLRVVLLCKGRGADASSYRPNRDESQWWNRRDALVRCVAAFLHGPGATSSSTKRELVLLFDEDFSRIHMSLSSQEQHQPPTEQQVLSVWKAAALKATSNTSSERGGLGSLFAQRSNSDGGLKCQVVLDKENQQQQTSIGRTSSDLPGTMDSKRQVLQHLQSNCSLQFLKKHRLNSTAEVVLRKTNKQKLVSIWHEWTKQQQKPMTSSSSKQQTTRRMESIFEELLQPYSKDIQNVVAANLHESCDSELPVFDIDGNKHLLKKDDMRHLQVCLFLGAVRDMTPQENVALEKACQSNDTPFVGVRLGPVPEFTSKILSVVAYHCSKRVLGQALLRLVNEKSNNKMEFATKPPKSSIKSQSLPTPSTTMSQKHQSMHIICTVPLSSDQLSTNLQDRQEKRALWACVRVTVCTLWRSRLASSSSGAGMLQTALTLVFEDGVTLQLDQDELVTKLAEQHQAAPSEYQILNALSQKVKRNSAGSSKMNPIDVDWSSVAGYIVESAMKTNGDAAKEGVYAIEIAEGASSNRDLSSLLYKMKISSDEQQSKDMVLVFLSIRPELPHMTSSYSEAARKGFVQACQDFGIPVLRKALLVDTSASCQDTEAATVTLLQHFIYQGRLFPCLKKLAAAPSKDSLTHVHRNEKKRSKKRRKEKTQKKRKRID